MKYLFSTLLLLLAFTAKAEIPVVVTCVMTHQNATYDYNDCMRHYPERLTYVQDNGRKVVLATKTIATCFFDGICTLDGSDDFVGQISDTRMEKRQHFAFPRSYILGVTPQGNYFAYAPNVEEFFDEIVAQVDGVLDYLPSARQLGLR